MTGAGRLTPTWEDTGPLAAASLTSGRLRASQTGRVRMALPAEEPAEAVALPFPVARLWGLQTGLFAVAAASAFFM